MPGIILIVSGTPDAELTKHLVTEISNLTCKALKKDLERCTMIIQYQPKNQWFIAGQSLEVHGKNAFRLQVMVTDETNTKAEKANFHRQAFAVLKRVIGNLHPHSNIHIVDCRASAYGYAGITQEEHSFTK